MIVAVFTFFFFNALHFSLKEKQKNKEVHTGDRLATLVLQIVPELFTGLFSHPAANVLPHR